MVELEIIPLLHEKKVPFRLIKLSEQGVSFEDVIKYAQENINPNEICKTIIVKDNDDNKYAFLLKGNQKVSFSKVKEHLKKKVSIISFDDLKKNNRKRTGSSMPTPLKHAYFCR